MPSKFYVENRRIHISTANTHARALKQQKQENDKQRTDTDYYIASGLSFNDQKNILENLFQRELPSKRVEDQNEILFTERFKVSVKEMNGYYQKLVDVNKENVDLKYKYKGNTLLSIFVPKENNIFGFVEVYFKKDSKSDNKLHIRFSKENTTKSKSEMHKFIVDNIYAYLSNIVFDFENKTVWLEITNDTIKRALEAKTISKFNVDRSHLRKNWSQIRSDAFSFNAFDFDSVRTFTNSSLERISSLQQEFKDFLLCESRDLKIHNCAIAGCPIKISKQSTIASHIKPWSECETYDEAIECENGILLCPNHDKLFDKGYITFDENGQIIYSKSATAEILTLIGITDGHLESALLNARRTELLEYHRKKVFR